MEKRTDMIRQEQIHCHVERYETTIPVKEFVERCVDVDRFLALCRQCPNYGRIWSCPPYDFDVPAYWTKYRLLRIVGMKVFVPGEFREQIWTPEEAAELNMKILLPVKKQMTKEMNELEQAVSGSIHLSAGSCFLCSEGCARREEKQCRFPKKMRYSIESLGGNVSKAAEYLGQTIEWMHEGRLPHYYLLISGLLYN